MRLITSGRSFAGDRSRATGIGRAARARLTGKPIHETVKYFVLVKHFVFMFVPTNIRAHRVR
jgi:hypothetical protein